MAVPEGEVTIENAVANVEVTLASCPLDGPVSTGVLYTPLWTTNYIDHKAYDLVDYSHLSRETAFMTQMEDALQVGEDFMWMLYAYRSCARAIPQVQQTAQSPDGPNKDELYLHTYELLKEEVTKMKRLKKFCDQISALVCRVIEGVSLDQRENFASPDFLFTLAKVMNLFVVMDALKNMKTSLNNDFSMYKRTLSNLTKMSHSIPDETAENHELYLFLGNHDRFAAKLKEDLAKVRGFDDVLIDMANTCADMLEREMYVQPSCKHLLLKAMAFGLSLADLPGDERDITKKKKQLRIDRFLRIVRALPVVPLFGDMSVRLSSIFTKTPHLSTLKWDPVVDHPAVAASYSLLVHVETVQKEYDDLICEIGLVVNTACQIEANDEHAPTAAKQAYAVMLKSLLFVSQLTAKVLEQSAWKYTHPTNSQTNSMCPEGATLYEMAVRYNYSGDELLAAFRYISMIKELVGILSKADSLLFAVIRRHVYTDVQLFVRTTLEEAIGHTVKRKRPIASILKHIRNIAADCAGGADVPDDSGTSSPTKAGKHDAPMIHTRNCSVSSSQLRFIRALLDQCYNEKAKGMKGGLLKEKDLKENQVEELSAFCGRSFYYGPMLNYINALAECSDLSDLWYKEFYLELSHEIQFPIEMSLPWMVTERGLDGDDVETLEHLLYPLDIYNDAANRALHRMRVQYMYDEIEAELNLCFDQFIFKLSEKIFASFKVKASSMRLDKSFKTRVNEMANNMDTQWETSVAGYEPILRMKTYQFLGRKINIAKLVAQTVNQHIRKSIDVAITRFESSDICAVVELEHLIENTRLAHDLMSEFLDLDPFEDMLVEMDDRTSLNSFEGRIISHVVAELTGDFAANFCYNSVTNRFVRSTVQISDPVARPALTKSNPIFMYGAKNIHLLNNVRNRMFNNFVDATHFQIIVRLLGRQSIAAVIGELSKCLKGLLSQEATLYIRTLGPALPQFIKLPLFEYGPQGTYDYFQAILHPVLGYADLHTFVFQAFREIGNAVLAVKMIEDALAVEDCYQSLETGVFFTREPTVSDVCRHNAQTEVITNLYAGYRRTNLMRGFLAEIGTHIQAIQHNWQRSGSGPPSATEQTASSPLLPLDVGYQFTRIWSSMMFAFCAPPKEKFSDREAFGDSLHWAGCTLIHLLGQPHRFAASDFSYHLAYVYSAEQQRRLNSLAQGREKDREREAAMAVSVDVQRFVDVVEFSRQINDCVFDYMERTLPLGRELKEVVSPNR